jgi:acetylglutamate kinase
MEPADVVLRFLESVGRRSEAEFYVSLFRAGPRERFAAISIDANVARYATDAVMQHLRFLADLGLTPTVVLGSFEPTDAPEHAARLRRRLERAHVPVELFDPGSGEGLAARVTDAARAGRIPLVVLGTADGDTPEDRFTRLGALLTALKTRKLLFLHRPGGLRQKGALLPLVNLTTDVAALAPSKELSRKEKSLLVQSRRLVLELVPHQLTVAITSPLNLLRELFTTKGAGTLLRRGAVIQSLGSYEALDRARLAALLSGAFGRPPRESFFDRPISRVYLEQHYRGAAILQATPLGMYLTKFAVDREAQGEGLGRDLWDAFVGDHPVVFWRARAQNPINEWYAKLADGLSKQGEWVVFWKGLAVTQLPEAIAWALAQPVDLAPPAPGPAP